MTLPCNDPDPEANAGEPVADGFDTFQAKLDRDHAALGGHEEVTEDGVDPGAQPGQPQG